MVSMFLYILLYPNIACNKVFMPCTFVLLVLHIRGCMCMSGLLLARIIIVMTTKR